MDKLRESSKFSIAEGKTLDVSTLKKYSGEKSLSTVRQKMAEAQTGLDTVMMFDITGSMFSYFHAVRENLDNIARRLKSAVPKLRQAVFGYRNHGDERLYDEILITTPLTENVELIGQKIFSIKRGGGGLDALTCLEDALAAANRLDWNENAAKTLVIIGDMPPHGVMDQVTKCPNKIDYRQEVEKLIFRQVKLYSVFCGHEKKAEGFFRSVAERSGGKFMSFDEIGLLSELLIGVGMKSVGRFETYIKQAKELNLFLPAAKREKIIKLLE